MYVADPITSIDKDIGQFVYCVLHLIRYMQIIPNEPI